MTMMIDLPHRDRIGLAAGTGNRLTSFLHRLVRNWHARIAVARLERLDDFLLRDAGLSRADLNWALKLPFSVNCEQALIDRVRRARQMQAMF